MTVIKTVFTAFLCLVFCQLTTAQIGLSLDKLAAERRSVSQKGTPQYKSLFLTKKTLKIVDNQVISANKPKQMPSIFSVEAMPFFCKIEYKMGLNKKLPIKFRLGDVQYVDELEGKR